MPQQKKKQSEKASYTYDEYLGKFRPKPLPDPPRIDASSDELAAEIIQKALQRIRQSRTHHVVSQT